MIFFDVLEGNFVWIEKTAIALRVHYLNYEGMFVATMTFYLN